jgi:hypothetical protein
MQDVAPVRNDHGCHDAPHLARDGRDRATRRHTLEVGNYAARGPFRQARRSPTAHTAENHYHSRSAVFRSNDRITAQGSKPIAVATSIKFKHVQPPVTTLIFRDIGRRLA